MVLEGKVALVTGGGQGLGRTLALGLAAAGADVVVAQRTVSRVEAVAAEIQDLGRRALAMHVDVTQKASVQAMIDTTVSTLGRLDVLVNNSGIFPITQVARMSEEEWDQVMATNLKGVFLCSQAALTPLRHAGGGRIINMASVSGLVGAVGFGHYGASKGGVIAFTKSLAREVASMGITVNAVSPGIVDDETTRRTFPEVALQGYLAQVPMRRLANPEDVVGIVVFLASPASAYITGQVFAVDGGFTMQ